MVDLQIFADRQPWTGTIAFLMFAERGDYREVVTNLVMTKRERDSMELTDPSFRLLPAAAQQLMDELWRCGLRPTEGTGSAGSLAATERHLKDMRSIAFKALGLTEETKR